MAKRHTLLKLTDHTRIILRHRLYYYYCSQQRDDRSLLGHLKNARMLPKDLIHDGIEINAIKKRRQAGDIGSSDTPVFRAIELLSDPIHAWTIQTKGQRSYSLYCISAGTI